ncbi:gliding motility-associated C-terminal domain-containing protein [Flavobacterium petrolei]|uniref:gliding motility-associated C-terminal domain-containing protein n=1 Tax=Flavobacterium petrolei TaxID=2259594 RepID=UPI003757AF1B
MIIKLPLIRVKHLYCFFSFFLFIFCTYDAYAQCSGIAGNDNNSLTICDITNVSSTAVNLNLQLGSHISGGTWKDDDRSGGLNRTTGILNAQLIKKSGVYKYTYTVSDGLGCTDTAVISITVGGYTGVPGSNASICNTKQAYNLFEAFNGDFLAPQLGGTWVGNTSNVGLNNNILDATNLNPGSTYEYTYSIPAIGSCAAPPEVKIFVTIYRSPQPGTPYDLNLCSNELSAYTNFNLNDQLIGEDSNGIWTETATDEIDNNDDTDSTINIQNIYNTKGPGTYRFTYTVFTDNNVCDDQSSSVDITIEKQLDYTGATLTVNTPICEKEIAVTAFSATLKDVVNIPDGSYSVTYTISGIGSPITTIQNFSNNVLTFPIASTNFSVPGNYTITVTNIVSGTSLNICNNIIPLISGVIKINPIPKINNATLTIAPVCQTSDAVVEFSGTSNLTDGSYTIVYNLSGSNIATAQSTVINVTGGLTSFFIPAGLIPNIGTTTIAITNIRNLTTGCTNMATLSKDFVVKALPDVTNLVVTIKDVCQNQPVTVELSGLGNLTSIFLSYTLSGSNNSASQIVTLAVNSGKASFVMPVTNLPNTGSTSFTITDLTNVNNGCSAIINPNSKSFLINVIPNNPTVTNKEFCKVENATVANLIPNGSKYRWYNSLTSTTALNSSALLVTGNYYVKEINSVTGCESGLEMVAIVINELSTPILNQDGENFCGLDNPTIQNLSDNVTSNGTLVWFDGAVSGNQLSATTLLQDNRIYYGFDSTTANNCFSTNPLQVTVSLTNCDVTADFFIPDGFSPNGDGVNETFSILDIDFLYPDYTLEIFNRYGNLMYTVNKNKPDWDGTASDSSTDINGKAPNGVYFYVINFNKGNTSPKQGRLYLNR